MKEWPTANRCPPVGAGLVIFTPPGKGSGHASESRPAAGRERSLRRDPRTSSLPSLRPVPSRRAVGVGRVGGGYLSARRDHAPVEWAGAWPRRPRRTAVLFGTPQLTDADLAARRRGQFLTRDAPGGRDDGWPGKDLLSSSGVTPTTERFVRAPK